MKKAQIGLILGPLLFILSLLFIKPEGLSEPARYTLAATLLMATWWVTEAVPIAITALLPLLLFPIMGVMPIKAAGATYGAPIIFLFIACFMLATAIERWNLHRRVALNIILKVGSKPSTIVLGFMIATAFLSMWLSNTATTIMMLPIGLSLVQELAKEGGDKSIEAPFTKALLLGIAYSASIGGIATIIGTPTNIIFAGAVAKNFGTDVSFVNWMLFATPVMLILLFICWWYLVRLGFPLVKLERSIQGEDGTEAQIKQYLKDLGPIKFEEIAVASVFLLAACGWLARAFWLKPYIPHDAIIALGAMLLLFIIPTRNSPKNDRTDLGLDDQDNSPRTVLDWDTAVNIPWGVILLFGGGLSLAAAFDESGLAKWIGQSATLLSAVPFFIIVLIIIAAVNFLTEITSNVATVSMVLPVLIAMSATLGVHPYYLMIGATCAASCAFMLPVATAPNAIVFGSNRIKIGEMMKAGVWLNILSIILFSIYVYFIMPLVFGI